MCTHRKRFENGHLDNSVSGLYLSNKTYSCMHPKFHVPELAASSHTQQHLKEQEMFYSTSKRFMLRLPRDCLAMFWTADISRNCIEKSEHSLNCIVICELFTGQLDFLKPAAPGAAKSLWCSGLSSGGSMQGEEGGQYFCHKQTH